MKKWMVNLLAVVTVMAVASSVWAAPLLPGSEVIPVTPTTGPSPAPWGSPTLIASVTSPYAAGSLSGTMTSMVFREAAGNLDFFYQVTSTSAHPAIHMSVAGFGSYTTNVYSSTDATILPSPANSSLGTVNFADIYRFDPDVVGADFLGGLANASTYWLIVQTNATTYSGTTAFIQDGAQATAASFAPAPLPSSLALFATGAVSLVGGLFRRFRRMPM
jgi:hypothetical protein